MKSEKMNCKDRIKAFIKWYGTEDDITKLYKYGLSQDDTIAIEPDTIAARQFTECCGTRSIYIQIEKFIKPTRLLDCWKKCIIENYIKTGTWELVEINIEYLKAKNLLKMAFHSPYSKGFDDNEYHTFISVAACDIEPMINKSVINDFICYNKAIENNYIKCVNTPISLSTFNEIINKGLVEHTTHVVESYNGKDYNRVMLKEDYELISNICYTTKRLIEKRLLYICIGLAGSGKSAGTIADVKYGKWMAISRSNTVCFELYSKFKAKHPDNKDVEFIPKSIAAYNCAPIEDCNVIIDEFSQWELHDLATFNRILENALKNHKQVHILGDPLQMKGFISRGSLLAPFYRLVKHHGGNCETKFDELHRCEDTCYNDSIFNYIKTRNVNYMKRYIKYGTINNISQSEYEEIIANGVILTDCGDGMLKKRRGCAYMNHIVVKYMAIQKGLEYDENKITDLKYNEEIVDELLQNGTSIKLLVNTTTIVDRDSYKEVKDPLLRMNFKIFRNEKATLSYDNGKYFVTLGRANTQTKNQITIEYTSIEEVFKSYMLGYSITVTRAQGLEWENVIYLIDKKCGTDFESFYVAMTRCREKCYCLCNEKNKMFMRKEPIKIADHFYISK